LPASEWKKQICLGSIYVHEEVGLGANECVAQKVGLNSKIGTAPYNISEVATGLYGESKPILVSANSDYGLTITGPKSTLPVLSETGAVLANTAVGIDKSAYDVYASVIHAFNGGGGSAAANGGFVICSEQTRHGAQRLKEMMAC